MTALLNYKALVALRLFFFLLYTDNSRYGRRIFRKSPPERRKRLFPALRMYFHIRTFIAYVAADTVFHSRPAYERAESDPLYNTICSYAESFNHISPFISGLIMPGRILPGLFMPGLFLPGLLCLTFLCLALFCLTLLCLALFCLAFFYGCTGQFTMLRTSHHSIFIFYAGFQFPDTANCGRGRNVPVNPRQAFSRIGSAMTVS